MSHPIKSSIVTLLSFSLIVGVAWPCAMTLASHLVFPEQSTGSLLRLPSGEPVGSRLVGQTFEGEKWFQGRPSTSGTDALPSGASQASPSGAQWQSAVEKRTLEWAALTPSVPWDMRTASGSGLDPHITWESAEMQAPRVAKARQIPLSEVLRLMESCSESRDFWDADHAPRLLRVLPLNLALDKGIPCAKP